MRAGSRGLAVAFVAGAAVGAATLLVVRGATPASGDPAADSAPASVRVAALEEQLARERALRAQREEEWLGFTRAVAALEVPSAPAAPAFLAELAAVVAASARTPPVEGDSREELLAERRAEELLTDLRALLAAEQIVGLDFLEVGRIADGATGPVVVRLLDDWGRPSGTLAADRLRLEGSRSGRNVTLVFERGFESHAGIADPFEEPQEPGQRRAGVRRIDLGGVDPEPWFEALPELFDDAAVGATIDDGEWDATWLRYTLNDLLERHSAGGHWRVKGIGGVVDDVLRDVQLVQLDDQGRPGVRVFADRARLAASGRAGVRIDLEDGVEERHGRRTPFVEGRFRVFLPGVDRDAWERAGLPGLESATAPAAPQEAADAVAEPTRG